jgi:hypothetical protein
LSSFSFARLVAWSHIYIVLRPLFFILSACFLLHPAIIFYLQIKKINVPSAKKKKETFENHVTKNAISLAVDHCHNDGHIRGLLCRHCNLLLSHAKDSLSILRAAIRYLQKPSPLPLLLAKVANKEE